MSEKIVQLNEDVIKGQLKGISFETAIIERYRRRESSVEEALIEMYLAGVSVRRVEDITEALWGSKVSPPPLVTRKCMSTLKIGEILLYKVDGTHMMGSIWAATGAESLKM